MQILNFAVSGCHRASLLSVCFINQLMHSIIRTADVQVYVIQNAVILTLVQTKEYIRIRINIHKSINK